MFSVSLELIAFRRLAVYPQRQSQDWVHDDHRRIQNLVGYGRENEPEKSLRLRQRTSLQELNQNFHSRRMDQALSQDFTIMMQAERENQIEGLISTITQFVEAKSIIK
jgi:hypothetical protein